MIEAEWLRAAGTSAAAVAHHYEHSDEFFALWLGPDLVYSCALWDEADAADTLQRAQRRKLDFFAESLGVRGGFVLDIGCGWGALLDRLVRRHGAAGGVGLTLSPTQVAVGRRRGTPNVDLRLESWVDHRPAGLYDAIACVEATEHLASDALDADEKVEVYRAFFARCASWLHEGGPLGLQLICLDNVGHEGSRPGRGPASELIRLDIFPESMPASLSELVLGWETHFELERFAEHHDHYRRTFRAWAIAAAAQAERARALVGDDAARTFTRYFAVGEVLFRLREHALYRVILRKRAAPKVWAVPPRPAAVDTGPSGNGGASPAALRSHYDVSNDFYALWLGPSMIYSSGLWSDGDDPDDLESALDRKIDFFAQLVVVPRSARVLDVGCGWGGNLRRLVARHEVASGVGLTLSPAQREHFAARPVAGSEVRIERWQDHEPRGPYDAILSYGAFEHFARDGTTGPERVSAYRAFFARCFHWLVPDGRLGLETIAHDGAPDTAGRRGRGPLGDFVLELFPESLSPHLYEIVLGFEPYFEVEVLRSDALDFARTFRHWQLRLRAGEAEASAIVGAPTVRRFLRYLAASEVQFRSRTLTNHRLVLHRRPRVRR
jgi:cyclopropane-fatty-acyl-phospholipid synthase